MDGKFEQARDLVGKMYDKGLMAFMAGAEPARVRFLMPLGCVQETHIDQALEILEQSISEMV